MLKFPMHNAALDLKGKPPAELPHGLLPIPPEVREIVKEQFARFSPEQFAPYAAEKHCWETVCWFFSDLDQPVIYRETPDGPDVLAVGREEVRAHLDKLPPEGEPAGVKHFQCYL